MDEETILVPVMQVNNEIGTVEPVAEAAKLVRARAKRALIHVDAIQSYGKMIVHPKKLDVDMLSVSGHKIHGPKGSGLQEKTDRMYELRDYFIREVTKIKDVTVNGKAGRESAPHIISVSVEGIRSEVLLHSLEEKNTYVSAGSACSSNKPSVSRTLEAIGLKKSLLDSTIRFSLCEATTKEEIDYALRALEEIIPFRRKFIRK